MNHALIADIVNYGLVTLSSGARLSVAALIVYGLIRFHEGLWLPERIGAGLIGGAALMTIPIVFDTNKDGTPFDVWAGTISAVGILTFVAGRLHRLRKHAANNQAMIDEALLRSQRIGRKAKQ